jgi:ferritin-like metal-binding protein YciE
MNATALDTQLVKYLADVHSVEEQALQQLRGAPEAAGAPELAAIFQAHLEETEGHERAIRDRLEAHGESPSHIKDLVMRVGGAGFLLFARAQPDTPGKLVAHAYSYEHLEAAAYELLIRVAGRAGHAETVETATRIRAEEQAMADRLFASFDAAVQASLDALSPDDLSKQLEKYLADAHAIEAQAIKLLEKASGGAGNPALSRIFDQHLDETREQQRLVAERLEARGAGPSKLKDVALGTGGLSWAMFFELHPDTPPKLVAFAYAFEHLEIAAYEELKRVAAKAGDPDTVELADRILRQERAAASTLAGSYGLALDAALHEPAMR